MASAVLPAAFATEAAMAATTVGASEAVVASGTVAATTAAVSEAAAAATTVGASEAVVASGTVAATAAGVGVGTVAAIVAVPVAIVGGVLLAIGLASDDQSASEEDVTEESDATPLVPSEPPSPLVPPEPQSPQVPPEPPSPLVPPEPSSPLVPPEPPTSLVQMQPSSPIVQLQASSPLLQPQSSTIGEVQYDHNVQAMTATCYQTQAEAQAEEEEEDEEKKKCICRDVTIPVLYVNMRSINPTSTTAPMKSKTARLRALISEYNPQLVVIVETWLKEKHFDEQVLELFSGMDLGYEIKGRYDRYSGHHPDNSYGDTTTNEEGRGGGGILVLWKRAGCTPVEIKPEPSENYADNVANFDLSCTFNCKKCCDIITKRFAFTVVYRRPSSFSNQDADEYAKANGNVIGRLQHLSMIYNDVLLGYSGWAMIGDFNLKPENPLLTFIAEAGDGKIAKLSSASTHRSGSTLDHVIASPGFVSGYIKREVFVTELVSDHAALVFNLNFGKDSPPGAACPAESC